jgi:hypothetical protein
MVMFIRGFLLAFAFTFSIYCFGQNSPQTLSKSSPESQQQIRNLIANLPDQKQINSLDEPAFRVFIRTQAAMLLWKIKSAEATGSANRLVTDAIKDLHDNQKEIPALYANLFRADLLSSLKQYAPDLAAKLIEEYKLNDQNNAVEDAYSRLQHSDEVPSAIDAVRRSVQSGKANVSYLIFFLIRLNEVKPSEVQKILLDIITVEENSPGSLSLQNLFMLKHQFIREDIPPDLQSRFLRAVIRATGNLSNVPDEERELAYNLLRSILPTIAKLQPSLSQTAAAQMTALGSALPDQSAIDQAEERIANSNDQLGQLVIEAESAKDPSLKHDFGVRAAQLALKKEQFKRAADLIEKYESDEKRNFNYHDQILVDCVTQALKKDDAESAEYAASKMRSNLKRAAMIRKLALYYYGLNDIVTAKLRLNDALKLIASSPDDIAKVSALLDTIFVVGKVDGQRSVELTQTVVKTINDSPQLNAESKSKPEDKTEAEWRKSNVANLLQVAHRIIPLFQLLAQKDEFGARSIAENFQRKEFKLAANFAIALGAYRARESSVDRIEKMKQSLF